GRRRFTDTGVDQAAVRHLNVHAPIIHKYVGGTKGFDNRLRMIDIPKEEYPVTTSHRKGLHNDAGIDFSKCRLQLREVARHSQVDRHGITGVVPEHQSRPSRALAKKHNLILSNHYWFSYRRITYRGSNNFVLQFKGSRLRHFQIDYVARLELFQVHRTG